MTRYAYDAAEDPPAPVLPLFVSVPSASGGVLVRALVDTAADCSVIPLVVARNLRLPLVDRVALRGITGEARRLPVHAASVELPGFRGIARLVAFGQESILGRDLLNRVVMRLDGPRLELSARPRRR